MTTGRINSSPTKYSIMKIWAMPNITDSGIQSQKYLRCRNARTVRYNETANNAKAVKWRL